jgi:hypothetical protein
VLERLVLGVVLPTPAFWTSGIGVDSKFRMTP